MTTINDIPFQQLIDALLDLDTPLNPRFLYRLSDLEADDLKQLKPICSDLPLWRKKALLEDVEELGVSDYLLDFMALGRFFVEDEDPEIRLIAVRILWEYEQSELIPVFLSRIERDQDPEVRAAAATALGRFIYAGEIEEIPASKLKKLEDALLKLVESEDSVQVRRSALESMGFSSREEVTPLIQKAFESSDKNWKASALFAMGRSANQVWKPAVLSMLENPIPLLREEAARAAGELEISEAVPFLMEMLDDPDDNTRSASIWSLSQIGGDDVREALERLYEEADEDDEIELLDSALENLTFTEGVKLMPFFDFPDELESEAEEDEWYSDLEEMDDLFDEEEDRSD